MAGDYLPPSGIALYKNRREAALRLSLPRMGKGDRRAVDRVLSLVVICAKPFFHLHHLSFISQVPYPPLRGTFPSRGRLTIRKYRHLKCGEAATGTRRVSS